MASWTEALSGLFQGSPQAAPSYTSKTEDVPKWLQDYTVDLFSQQRAVAALPYQQYQLPRIAQQTAPTQQAYDLVQGRVGAWQNPMNTALTGTQNLAQTNPGTTQGLNYMGQAAGMSGVEAAQPYTNAAAAGTQASMLGSSLSAASPFIGQAGQSSANFIGDYMNPYNEAVTDRIAQLGARNLTENLLPGVSDQFVRAGQFGSSRMGEFGSRALRDTQEAILGQQAQALQTGYGQALSAAQQEAQKQAGLASTVGQLSSTDLARMLSGAGQLGTLGQQMGALTGQQQQALANIGQQYAATTGADLTRQQGALAQMSELAKIQQGLSASDAAALQSIGLEQQQQAQRGLDVAYQDFLNQQAWPQQQINNMSTTLRGLNPAAVANTQTQTGYSTQFAPSPLSQLASAYFTTKALGQ